MTAQSRSDDSTRDECCGAALRADSPESRTAWHLAKWYEAKGWTVRTRLPGWGLPPRVDGHMPVLYASNGKQEVAIDVVVPDGAAPPGTHQRAFRAWSSVAQTRRYSLESAHKSGANRVDNAPAGGWSDNGGRNFW